MRGGPRRLRACQRLFSSRLRLDHHDAVRPTAAEHARLGRLTQDVDATVSHSHGARLLLRCVGSALAAYVICCVSASLTASLLFTRYILREAWNAEVLAVMRDRRAASSARLMPRLI